MKTKVEDLIYSQFIVDSYGAGARAVRIASLLRGLVTVLSVLAALGHVVAAIAIIASDTLDSDSRVGWLIVLAGSAAGTSLLYLALAALASMCEVHGYRLQLALDADDEDEDEDEDEEE